MKMDRTRVRVRRRGDGSRDERPELTPEELVGMIWELTVEAYSLAGSFDPDAKMRRDVVRVIRRRR